MHADNMEFTIGTPIRAIATHVIPTSVHKFPDKRVYGRVKGLKQEVLMPFQLQPKDLITRPLSRTLFIYSNTSLQGKRFIIFDKGIPLFQMMNATL